MANENVEKCQDCGNTLSVRVLRYVRGPDGKWAYLCTACRKRRRGETG